MQAVVEVKIKYGDGRGAFISPELCEVMKLETGVERMDRDLLRRKMDKVYRIYNQREYVHPDPLEFLYGYEDPGDREIVALIAALMAYGRVEQILTHVEEILEIMGPSPRNYLISNDEKKIRLDFENFLYRFTRGSQIAALLLGIKGVLADFGSLDNCFLHGFESGGGYDILKGQSWLIQQLSRRGDPGFLTAHPEKGSACKRNNLFLRWMVRRDRVDPGGWSAVSPAHLIVPLDTHMYRMGVMLGFTRRRQANMKTALEVTQGFRDLIPEDPVKYDFCLTRFGIRREMEPHLLKEYLLDRISL